MGEELILGGVGDVVPQSLSEELVGGGEVFFAVAEEHTGPVFEGGPGRLGHQRGLADTGLTRDQQDLAALACGDALGRIGDGLQLGFSSDDADRGRTTRRPGSGTVAVCRPRRAVPTRPRRSRPGRADLSGRVLRSGGTGDGCAGRP